MTVSSTAASGGGLRDYGIFHNESVFTVYVEMTHSPTRAPSWILQYAQLRPSAPDGTPAAGSIRLGDHVVAPYPVTKENPEFPNDLVARNLGKLVVVYGEINVKGKVENTRIVHSPNPLLNRPALDALKKWEFRPAVSNGRPVPVKILVGIPLSLPPA
jgi:TonB family protein